MVNKNYRKGAEDVAEVAAEGFDGIGENLKSISEGMRSNNEKQHKLTTELIALAEGHEQRLRALEYRLPAIDFGLVDTLPSEKRALLGGIIRSVPLPDGDCRRIAGLIISRFGAEPLSSIDNDQISLLSQQISLLSQDVQRLCAYYLYVLLRSTDGNAGTEKIVNDILDEFIISNKEKRQIKSVIDDYGMAGIDELIKAGKVGKQNIIVIGQSGAISASLINSVLGKIMVNDGFCHDTDDMIPEVLETRESPIRFCGIFKLGCDIAKNAHVLETVKKIVSAKSGIDRISNIWCCISTLSRRVERFEISLLKELLITFKNVREC